MNQEGCRLIIDNGVLSNSPLGPSSEDCIQFGGLKGEHQESEKQMKQHSIQYRGGLIKPSLFSALHYMYLFSVLQKVNLFDSP